MTEEQPQTADEAAPNPAPPDSGAAGTEEEFEFAFPRWFRLTLYVAFAIFILIRNLNKLKREEEAPAAEPTTKDCPYCFSKIAIKATRCPQCTTQLQEG